MREGSRLARNYILCEPLLAHGVLAGTTARLRDGSDFNLSYSHAESREGYLARLDWWLRDFGFERAFRESRVFFLHLVHGTHVLHVDGEAIAANAPGTFVQECDGLVTGLHGEAAVVLTVKTADCIPAFLFDPSTRASCLVHCGWRGLRDGILRSAVESLVGAYACSPTRLLLHMGPFICPNHYEVGPEVAELFPFAVERRADGVLLDLGRILSEQALAAGIPAVNISSAGLCTCERGDLCFSYRRDGPGGAMLSFLAVPT